MKNIDILYLYQHVARELDIACIVSNILKTNYNIKIKISHWRYGLDNLLNKYKPKIVILPFCYNVNDFTSILLKCRKSIFINLAWEQLFSDGTKNVKAPRDYFSHKHVFHQAWGIFFSEYLQQHGVLSENIFVNGNPTYMLYHEPYRKYYNKDDRSSLADKHNLDISKKWILFPENYGMAFYSNSVIEGFSNRGGNKEEVTSMRNYSLKCFEKAFLWCSEVAKNDDRVQFIIRPRPAISLKIFTKKLKQIVDDLPSNFRVIKDGSIREWILASDVIISSYSTSLIEAAVADKSVYMIEPYPLPESLLTEWYEFVDRITSKEALFSISGGGHSHNYINLSNWARKLMMLNNDPIKNLAKYIAEKLKEYEDYTFFPDRSCITPNSSKISIPSYLLGLLYEYRNLKYSFRNFFDLKSNKQNYYLSDIEDYLSQQDIENISDRWKQVLF